MKYPLSALAMFALLSHAALANADADQNGKILSKEGLPACVKTVSGSGSAPNWDVQNQCGGTIEIGWCWVKAFPGWINQDNVCAKTGVLSSEPILEGAQFAFPDRPHADPAAKFQSAAMLSVTRVCRVNASGICPEQ